MCCHQLDGTVCNAHSMPQYSPEVPLALASRSSSLCKSLKAPSCTQLACFLVTAWEAFAKWEEKTIWECPVEFTNVSVYQPVQVERTAKVALNVIFNFSQEFQARPLWLLA